MRVIIVDDDKLVCVSLKTILSADTEIDVCAVGGSADDAVSLYEELLPDILLMDIRMGGKSGLEAGEEILSKHKDAKVLFLTTFTDNEYIIKALKMGAKGYIIKQNIESIVPALKAVYSGQNVFGSEVVTKLPLFTEEKERMDFSHYGITKREEGIIELVAAGDNNKEIAEKLFLSEGTVRNNISTILEKLCLRDRTQLAVFYYQNR